MGASSRVGVLVADDSPLFRDVLEDIVRHDDVLELVGVAENGRSAVELNERLRPDIVVLDIHMPVMSGLEAIEHMMSSRPVPIAVMTGDPAGSAGPLSFEALSRGAVELLQKPASWPGTRAAQKALCERLALIASVPVIPRGTHRPSHRPSAVPAADGNRPRPVVIGIVSSTGGPNALRQLLGGLPTEIICPILIVQHLVEGFEPHMAEWLDRGSPLHVRLAESGERPPPRTALIAPAGRHMVIRNGRIRLETAPPVHGHLPSGTRLLDSLADAYGRAVVGCVLTGMGSDGAQGLLKIRQSGGSTFAQAETSCAVFGMPKAAQQMGAAERMVTIPQLTSALQKLAKQPASG